MQIRIVALVLFVAAVASSCGVNPVTGRREIQFASAAQEVSTGAQGYAPAAGGSRAARWIRRQQANGGTLRRQSRT